MRIWMAIVGGLVFSMTFGISSPRAEDLSSLGDLKSAYEAGGSGRLQVVGLSDGLMAGFMTANAVLENRGDAPLFCVPEKLVPDGNLVYRQTLAWSADVESGLDKFYPVAAFWALEEAFPCD